jgi:hypothetical protein
MSTTRREFLQSTAKVSATLIIPSICSEAHGCLNEDSECVYQMTQEGDQVISIEHEGVQIYGTFVWRAKCDFVVRITWPYQNMSLGTHIPNITHPFGSFWSSYSTDKCPENLLVRLYEHCQFLDRHFDRFTELVREIRSQHLSGPSLYAFDDFFESEFQGHLQDRSRREIMDILDGIKSRLNIQKFTTIVNV